jgi:hypothetical protein
MSKVKRFSKKNFIGWCKSINEWSGLDEENKDDPENWFNKFDGKTQAHVLKSGHFCDDDWTVEVEA